MAFYLLAAYETVLRKDWRFEEAFREKELPAIVELVRAEDFLVFHVLLIRAKYVKYMEWTCLILSMMWKAWEAKDLSRENKQTNQKQKQEVKVPPDIQDLRRYM